MFCILNQIPLEMLCIRVTHVHTTCTDMISGTHDLHWHDITITWFLPYFDFILVWKPIKGVLGLHASLSSRLKKYWTRVSLCYPVFFVVKRSVKLQCLQFAAFVLFFRFQLCWKRQLQLCWLCVFGGVEKVIADEFHFIGSASCWCCCVVFALEEAIADEFRLIHFLHLLVVLRSTSARVLTASSRADCVGMKTGERTAPLCRQTHVYPISRRWGMEDIRLEGRAATPLYTNVLRWLLRLLLKPHMGTKNSKISGEAQK